MTGRPGGSGGTSRIWEALTRPRGNRTWDAVIRGTGLIGAVAIPLVLLFPALAPPVAFILLTVWLNGPLSPLVPTGYEPLLMLMGEAYAPLLVAGLGCLGVLFIEFVTYELYRKVLGAGPLRKVGESDVAGKLVRLFRRSPFLAVFIAALTPLPFWAVQVISPLSGYPVHRHLAATVAGRFPRYWLFAALGGWLMPSAGLLLGIAVAGFGAAVVMLLVRRRRTETRESGIGEEAGVGEAGVSGARAGGAHDVSEGPLLEDTAVG